jgi:NADH-quinone oxidoreductase subunit H
MNWWTRAFCPAGLPYDPQQPVPDSAFWGFLPVDLIAILIKMIVVFTVYMVGVAMLTLAERKLSAWIQDRHGPNRVLKGWGQPLADGVKNFMKEETLPKFVNRPLFLLAPALSFIPALITWAAIPFGAPLPTCWGRVDMVLANLPVGYLYVLALSSLGVYGIVFAGWASNNKYSLLGGLRSSAQMISYEIPLGMSMIAVLIMTGNVSFSEIVRQQTWGWNVLRLTLGCFIFMVSAFAENNRLPFDLPEAESELITGYHTEYSSMKFSLFFIAEYANMVTQSAMIATIFFGGWSMPWLDGPPWTVLKWILSVGFFLGKVLFFLFVFMWIRWTLPRFRYDQLMSLGWKVLLPWSLAYIVIVAGAVLGLDVLGIQHGWLLSLDMFVLNIVLMVVVFLVIDRGRLVSPASSRIRAAELARLRAVSKVERPVEVLPQ